jgi:cysteinyl-tRNA synthetase
LSARDIAKKYEENFKKYLSELRISFDQHPKATDYIPEQIAIVQTLVDK